MLADDNCIPNIGPQQRRHRVVAGLVLLTVAVVLAGGLLITGVPRAWRMLVVLPAAGAALGFFQAQARTCVALAARGVTNMDDGVRAIADPREAMIVRAQSRRVYVRAIVAAVAATALLIAL